MSAQNKKNDKIWKKKCPKEKMNISHQETHTDLLNWFMLDKINHSSICGNPMSWCPEQKFKGVHNTAKITRLEMKSCAREQKTRLSPRIPQLVHD